MTPNELQERRKQVIENLRCVAGGGCEGRVSPETAQLLVDTLDDAKFVAEALVGGDPYYVTSVEREYAQRVIDAVGDHPLPEADEDFDQPEITIEEAYEQGLIDGADSLLEYKLSDDVLEHVEANDYTLQPEYPSVWVAVDSLSVYICRMNGGLLVEVHPNHAEAARPYAKSFVEFEPEEGAE